MDITVHWSGDLGGDVAEVLTSLETDNVGGDHEWRLGAVYLYDLPDGLDTGELVLAPGTYFRTVHGNEVRVHHVTGHVREYVQQIEQAYLAETGGCPDCGARAGELCRREDCQY